MTMRGVKVRWLVAALAGFGSAPAGAERSRPHRSFSHGTIKTRQFDAPRLPVPRLRPADDGIIHWNTPNKDGNLGGPGTGGGNGGGG
jgi:hypothetical protein